MWGGGQHEVDPTPHNTIMRLGGVCGGGQHEVGPTPHNTIMRLGGGGGGQLEVDPTQHNTHEVSVPCVSPV